LPPPRQDKNHIKGEGDVIKKPLTVDAFHGIVLEGAADVVITQAATQQVEVEGQPNIAALVTTAVKDGIWTVGTGRASYSTNKPSSCTSACPPSTRSTSKVPVM
jgi:hypothetical protein